MKNENIVKNLTYFDSFDYLRVFFALSIIAWHTKVLGPTGLISSQFGFNFKDFIYGSIFLLGVPLFVQISLFLYLLNRENKSKYFIKRILDLFFLYFFWMAALILIFYKESGLKILTKTEFWLSGGATPLYFLMVIIILTILLELFLLLEKTIDKKNFLIITLFALIVSIVANTNKVYLLDLFALGKTPFIMSHWSPINFLPYLFSSILFLKIYKDGFLKQINIFKWAIISLVVFLTVAVLEYLYLPNALYLENGGMIIPTYSRLSLVLGTCLVFSVAISKDYRSSDFIKKISGLTMGIYILHIFVMNILAGVLGSRFETISGTPLYFVIVTLVSLLIANTLKEKRII